MEINISAKSGSPGVGQKLRPLVKRDSSLGVRAREERLTTVFFLSTFICKMAERKCLSSGSN